MDRILYLVVSEPGGCDGMDRNAEGGNIIFTSFSKDLANRKIGVDSRYKLEKRVIDIHEARQDALKKLDKIDQLVLESFWSK